jgi:RNA polymerase sigma-70 factor (ECF subfamily)
MRTNDEGDLNQGSTAPFADLAMVYRDHHQYVWRTLYHAGTPRAGIDDALQDVFLVVQRKLDTFDGRTSIRNWLHGISRRVASEHRRRVKATKPLHLVENHGGRLSDADPSPRVEAAQLVEQFLTQIDARKREVFVLAEVEGMSAPEIAELLGLNVNTVYARLRGARLAFEKAVARFETRHEREREGAAAWTS